MLTIAKTHILPISIGFIVTCELSKNIKMNIFIFRNNSSALFTFFVTNFYSPQIIATHDSV